MTSEVIKLNDKEVDSSLKHKLENDTIIFDINKDTNVDVEFKGDVKVDFNISDNIKVDIIETINMDDLDIVYNVGKNSYVNIFTKPDIENKQMIFNKHIQVARDSEVEVSNAFFDNNSMHYNFELDLNGEQAQGIHNVAVISMNHDHKNINVRINNNKPNTTGMINNFGVVKNEAILIFNGTGSIAKKAVQSVAHQASKIITFDEGVTAQANPFLLINENDVEASHAAAVGRMDEDQLFYMQSRGIDFEHASRLITYGYLKPVLNKIRNDDLRVRLEKVIEEKVGFDV